MKEESKEKSILRELGSWLLYLLFVLVRSEERRVGKECRL